MRLRTMLSTGVAAHHQEVMSGYGAQRRSPVALAGTVAVHALLVGAFLLLPKEVIRDVFDPPPLTTTNIPLPVPPPEQPKPVERTEQPIETQPRPQEPIRIDPFVPLTTPDSGISGRDTPQPFDGMGKGPTVAPPVEPAHVPVLTEASIAPGAMAGFQPDYPGAMIRQGLEGTVTVRVTISPEGRVTDIERISATDESFWLATQRHALRKWRFRAATRDGVAVSSSKVLTVRFTLTDR